MKAKNLLGKRCLVKETEINGGDGIAEVNISEMSPSKEHVKLTFEYGKQCWYPIDKVQVVEVLDDLLPRTKGGAVIAHAIYKSTIYFDK